MISATQIAVSAYEQALAAAKREEREKREAEEREFQERVQATLEHANRLLGRDEWFPGVRWRVWHDRAGAPGGGYGTGNTLIVADEPADIRLLVVRSLVDMNEPTAGFKMRVYYPTLKSDRGTGFAYWDDPEVKSAADVGRCLISAGNPLASDRHVV